MFSMKAIATTLASASAVATVAALVITARKKKASTKELVPLSVNYHFLRECNYKCKFCFHTDLRSPSVELDKAKNAIKMLHDAGMKKINFSGGEPFLRAKDLGRMCKFAKDIGVESVSIISNGSLITEAWMENWGTYVDILGISCDSFDHDTNEAIGRQGSGSRGRKHMDQAFQVAEWCLKYGIIFKLNTVVNALNVDEDMSEGLQRLQKLGMQRWKVFQCLAIAGENTGENAIRDVSSLLITDEKFQAFLNRHRKYHPVHEENKLMRNSYLILDEKCRFLNNQDGAKVPSRSILEVGVAAALLESGFEEETFYTRGGKYNWSRNMVDIESIEVAA